MRKPGQFAGEPLLLPIDIDAEPIEERLTAWGGAALLVQAVRSLDLPGALVQTQADREFGWAPLG